MMKSTTSVEMSPLLGIPPIYGDIKPITEPSPFHYQPQITYYQIGSTGMENHKSS